MSDRAQPEPDDRVDDDAPREARGRDADRDVVGRIGDADGWDARELLDDGVAPGSVDRPDASAPASTPAAGDDRVDAAEGPERGAAAHAAGHSDPHPHPHAHAHATHPPHGHAATPVRPSTWAVVGTLWLVVIAVLFGIFGPQISARGHVFGGVPADELVGAAAERHADASAGRTGASGDGRPIDARVAEGGRSIDGAISALFGTTFATPDLAALGLSLDRVNEITLPGADAGAVHLLYRDDDDVASVFVLPDRGQFVSRDAFGQPSALSPGRVFQRSEVVDAATGASALFSDGAVVWLVLSADPDLVDAVLDELLVSDDAWRGRGDA